MSAREPYQPTVDVYESADALAHAAADHLVQVGATAIFERGRFLLAISGGSTPARLFALLASPRYAPRIAWDAVHVCWVDERCVPPDDSRSNFAAAHASLLSRVPIPAPNVHRMRGEDPPAQAALDYERVVRSLLSDAEGPPRAIAGHRFDLVLLGLGADGHTASMFPHGDVVHEAERWVCETFASSVAMWRLTLTAPLINAAADVMFLVTGMDKAETVQRVLHDAPDPAELPAQIIAPTAGRLAWLIDATAARLLPR